MSNLPETPQEKSDNFETLPAYEFFAIQEKYRGVPYKQICVNIKEKYDKDIVEETVKHWFWKKGKLLTMYRDYADTMIDLEMEECRDFIRGNVSKAAKTLARVMAGDGGPAQVMAAREFLDRGLGKVKERTELSGVIGVFTLKDFIEYGVKSDRDKQGVEESGELAEQPE